MSKEKNISGKVVDLFFSGRYSSDIESDVYSWLIDGVKPEAKDRAMRSLWDKLRVEVDRAVYVSLAQVNRKLGFGRSPQLQRRDRLHTSLRVAAVVLPLMVMVAAFFRTDRGAQLVAQYIPKVEVVVPDGQPGKTVTLPDGTTAMLNAGSTLSYPRWFLGSHREVILSGEGYFSVTPNPGKPFMVHMDKMTVNVLGTKFDAMDYPGISKAVVKVQQGKVGVESLNRQFKIEAGRQLSVDVANGDVRVGHVPTNEVYSWSRGALIFEGNSPEDIISTIERRFNVKFDIDKDVKFPNECYSIKFVDNENLQQMLEVLTPLIGGFGFQIRGDAVRLTKQ